VVSHQAYKDYLPQALESLRTQTNHELILVNNETNTLARACNAGIEESTGDYIVRVDSDDWVDPQLLSTQRQYLDEHPDIDCVWCDYWEAHPVSDSTYVLEHHPNEELEHACGAMYRRDVWETLKYDEDLEYQESYDCWQRFKRSGYKAARIPLGLYFYRKGHQSLSTNPERDRLRAELQSKYLN